MYSFNKTVNQRTDVNLEAVQIAKNHSRNTSKFFLVISGYLQGNMETHF